jgi:parallel beta-helix repeat protein
MFKRTSLLCGALVAMVSFTVSLAGFSPDAMGKKHRPPPSAIFADDNTCPAVGTGTLEDPYCSIQDAVDAAGKNGTVQVFPGNYPEAVLIESDGLTLEARSNRAVIDTPLLEGTAVTITADDVTVRNLLLKSHDNVVDIPCVDSGRGTSGITLENNQLGTPSPSIDEPAGIVACDTDDLLVLENEMHDTLGPGIVLGVIAGGVCGDDGPDGEDEGDVNNSRIEGNSVGDSSGVGILVCSGEDNVVTGNVVRSPGATDPTDGIQLASEATSNCLEDNLVSRASRDGIVALLGADDNVLRNNKSTGNTRFDINDLNAANANEWGDNICHDSGGTAGECGQKAGAAVCD